MPKFGTDYYQPRMDFFNPNIELISKNIKDTEAVHNNAMKAYSDMNAAILKDDTLHPDERTKRLKRLEDKVFKDINSFSGNTAQASDTILNSIINERKDPFYNLDKQYTNVYNAAQANRAKLEAEGKSAFMRDAYGNEIDALPTLFDKDGNMRSQQDFQFDYEGILDYNAAAEKLVNDIESDLYASNPKLVRNSPEVRKLIGDFIRTGSVETTDQNVKNVFNKSLKAYQQTPEYDQMRRRGIEGSALSILDRAAEERKYTKEHKVDTLLNEIAAKQSGSGKPDEVVGASFINPESTPIVGTEKEAKIANDITDEVNSNISGIWTSEGFGTAYSNPVVKFENGRLQENKMNVGGRQISIPLTKSRALSELTVIDKELPANEKALIDQFSKRGITYVPNTTSDVFTSNDNKIRLRGLRGKISTSDYESLENLLTKVEDAKAAKYSLEQNIDNLDKSEKNFLSKYKTTVNNLIDSGLAQDTQEAMLFVKNHEINNSIRDKKKFGVKDQDKDKTLNKSLINEVSSIFVDAGGKFIKLPNADSDEEIELDEDDKLKAVKKGEKSDPASVTFGDRNDIFNENSSIRFVPELQTVTIGDNYAVDPQVFKNKYAVLAPDMKFLGTVKELLDLSDKSANKVKRVYTDQGAQSLNMIIDGRQVIIPAGSILNRKIINSDNGAAEVVEVVNPSNGAVNRYELNSFVDAADKAVTDKVLTYLLPKAEIGKMRDNLVKERDVIRQDFPITKFE